MREHVGRAIKRLREAKRWTLDELAQASGTDRGTLNRIELEKQNPHRVTLRSIVRALELRADQVSHPRLLEAIDETGHGGEGGGARIEDRLGDLLAYIKTLEGQSRKDFIRAVVALLTALEHARPAAGTRTPENDGR